MIPYTTLELHKLVVLSVKNVELHKNHIIDKDYQKLGVQVQLELKLRPGEYSDPRENFVYSLIEKKRNEKNLLLERERNIV